MASNIVLSAAMRNNLLALSNTQSNIDRTQGILSTGLKVSSALDNPQNFFAAQALKNRSGDLGARLDGIGQSVQTVKGADKAVKALTKLVEQADSIVSDAREAISGGGQEASIVGNKDLSAVKDLTTLTGSGANAQLEFTIRGEAGTSSTATVSVGSGTSDDSVDQFIARINDVRDTAGNRLLEASLTSDGNLKIKAIDATKAFTIRFDVGNDNAYTYVDDKAFADALGLGDLASNTAIGTAAGASTTITAVSNSKLESTKFTKNSSGDVADASTLLSSVLGKDGTGNRFTMAASTVTSVSADTNLQVTINGTTTELEIDSSTTVAGLVDKINNDSTLNASIKASYNDQTGVFSIEAITADVKTVGIGVETNYTGTSDAGATGAFTDAAIDFEFGYATTALGTTAVTVSDSTAYSALDTHIGESYVLGSAASTLSTLEANYNTVREQIDALVEDSGYRGVNLLKGDTLNTYFNEDRSNKLETTGSDLTAAGLGIGAADFSRAELVESAASSVAAALTDLRTFSSGLANNLSIIQTREEFTKDLVNNLDEGADKLTVADQNEQGANLLALQTRQQLGVQTLSLANQAQQSILRLF